VRITVFVGEGVVLAVVGDPIDHRSLHRHRAQHREHVAQPGVGFKRAVRE
jgi:hypothetical protein